MMTESEYLVLHQLRQRPSDVFLQSVESHWRLVSQDVHALREFVSHCKKQYRQDDENTSRTLEKTKWKHWPADIDKQCNFHFSLAAKVS